MTTTGTQLEGDMRLLLKGCRSKAASSSTQTSQEDGEVEKTDSSSALVPFPHSDCEVIRLLQSGHSGINVYLVKTTQNVLLARKVRPLAPSGSRLLTEFQIMTELSHPNIVKGHSYDLGTHSEIIDMEYCQGEDLHTLISSSPRKLLPEHEARPYFYSLCKALAECHRNGIAHLDIKPENCFLTDRGELKLGDFGFARHCEGMVPPGVYGTLCYNSPEIRIGLPFDGKAADIFAAGVLLFKLVAGHLPYRNRLIRQDLIRLTSDPETYWKELETKLERSLYIPVRFSSEIKALLCSLLSYNPRHRPNIEQVLTCPWLQVSS